jgi:SMC interacting uncharacterized protein involved in chromosome segregation
MGVKGAQVTGSIRPYWKISCFLKSIQHLTLYRMHRSSTQAKSSGPKQDPRRLGDKDFKENCIKVLIGYLSTHGYDQPVTPKMLYNPMGKDVTNIMQFLMRQVPHASLKLP